MSKENPNKVTDPEWTNLFLEESTQEEMEILATNPVLGCKILLRLAEEMSRSLAADYGTLRALGYPLPEGLGGLEALAQADPTLS